MTDKVQAYIDLLGKAGGKTGDVRDRINKVLDTLESSLAARGRPWGTDEIGDQFANGANGYQATSVNLVKGGRNMSGTFDNFSDAQLKAAKDLRDTDFNSGRAYGRSGR
ncbi:hypothetical protein [Nocardia huaxiensis]|uniref:WXG100 family type VII secretion target n=1 Tax=Nocardia huaxiensis TaxID=2755382 RepID=A0A7D6ZYR6_9NOCA|nr:hypothetical protein [Nocardia huaxiensis]QLY31849.1 hypothetical protein H0264_05945 [Nocardia huaxiensis]UFS95414.1 hypothetical protein LPY97_32815 [Nocardia huaxiensis]